MQDRLRFVARKGSTGAQYVTMFWKEVQFRTVQPTIAIIQSRQRPYACHSLLLI